MAADTLFVFLCCVIQEMDWLMIGDNFDCPMLTVGQVDGSISGQCHAQLETRLICANFFLWCGDVSIFIGVLGNILVNLCNMVCDANVVVLIHYA